MSDRPDDADFVDHLYRSGDPDGPSTELDQRILDAAAAASRRRRRLGLPLAGLASAAVVVLAVGLLLRQPLPPLEAKRESAAMSEAEEMPAPRSRQPAAPAAQPGQPGQPARKSLAREPVGSPVVPELAESRVRRNAAADSSLTDGAASAADETRPDPGRALSWQIDSSAIQQLGAVAELTESRTVGYVAEACSQPYSLPAGATIRTLDGGLEVTVDETTFTLVCEDGRWIRQPVPQSSR